MGSFFEFVWMILATILAVVWWIVSYLVWIAVWFLLPFLVAAFIALRVAEKALGPEVVRAWVKARAMKFGTGSWERIRPWLFALGVLPFRVLAWFVVLAVWHAIVSLFWRPRWKPWPRAWEKRWKPAPRMSKQAGGRASQS